MITEEWSDSNGKYIRIEGDDSYHIADRILERGCIETLLPVQIERVNGRRDYVYETERYEKLGDYLESKPLSVDGWRQVISGILDITDELERFLLAGEHLVITCDTVFIGDKDTVRGIYVSEHRQNISAAIAGLIETAIKYPEYDREAAEYIYSIHDRLITGSKTKRQIRELIGTERNEEAGDQYQKDLSRTSEPKKKLYNMIKKNNKDSNAKSPRQNTDPDQNKKLLPLLLVAAGILIPTVLMVLGIFDSKLTGRRDYWMMTGAYVFFLTAAGYGARRLWQDSEPDIIFDMDEEINVCLIPTERGTPMMPVIYFPWHIGADEKRTDGHIEGKDISPIHASIQRESRSVYLIDEESGSGTYLNSTRIPPFEKKCLADGDKLSFGGISYIVEIT
ncbi:MAG: FHA domain-containing protein [Eubacterium sp.]|nr:FHA domain-containing protein [Eubacterium sp.]